MELYRLLEKKFFLLYS